MKVNLAKLQAKRDAARVHRDMIRTNERNARRSALIANMPRRRAVIAAANDSVVSIPKQPRERCPHLLEMAKGKACLFWFVPECRRSFDTSTTVHAHDNRLSANKGKGYKAHDWRGLQGCFECHFAYDQGNAHTREEKNAAFDLAFEQRQIPVWREIANNPMAKASDRRAARWAIDRYELHQLKGDMT